MVGAIGNLSASATTPLSVRASAAADILATDQAARPSAPSAPISDVVSTSNIDQKLPLYNSIEFIYRQDFGKVVLLEQQPDTGQEITQVPSQYRLQQYAATIRAQRRTQLEKLFGGEEGQPQHRGTQGQAAAGSTGTGVKPTATTPTAPAPAPQTAPAPQAAPQAAPAAAAPAAHVDIRV